MRASLRAHLFGLVTVSALFGGCNCKKGDGGPGLQADVGIPSFKLPDGGPNSNTLDFGNVPVTQHVRLNLGLTNIGPGSMGLQSQVISGPDADAGIFTEPSPFKAQLGVGATETAIFQFAPQQSGTFTDQFTLNDTGEPSQVIATLTGVGVDIDIAANPSQVNFGGVQVGVATPPVQQVTFTNNGASPVTIQADATATDLAYQITDSSGPISSSTKQTLSGNGGTYVVNVQFAPSVVGNDTSSFGWTGCTTDSTPICANEQSVALNGVGIDAVLTMVPTPIAFSGIGPGQTSTQTVTITNTGSNSATISCARLQNEYGSANTGCETGSATFALEAATPAIPTLIVPAAFDGGVGTVTLPVTYTASQNGNDSDTLVLDYTPTTAAAPKSASDQLIGNGAVGPCAISIAPPSINFGSISTNGAVATASTTLTNLGQSDCSVTGVTLDPSSDNEYALASGQATSFTIAAGANASIAATFTLSNTGSPALRTGDIDFQSNDASHANAQIPLAATVNINNPYAGGWPKWHYDNNNSGQTAADTSGLQGVVAWSFSGQLASAQQMNQSTFGSSADCGGEAYVNSPIVADDPSSPGTYYIYQVSLDGNLYSVSQTGTLLWKTMLSDPSEDPHPSTPAATKTGNIWAVAGSDDPGGGLFSTGNSTENLFYLSQSGSILSQQIYGEDGFDACPGLGTDGTLYEADDDASSVPAAAGSDQYSAIAFTADGTGQVSLEAGLSLPLTNEAERFGIAIGNDGTSYWGNNGQFFSITPVAPGGGGFQINPAWPAAGVSVGNSSSGALTIYSDLALDPVNTGFVYAYSSWETQTSSGGGRHGGGGTQTTAVQGVVAALSMATGAVQWTYNLPATNFPASWAELCSDSGNAAPAVANDGTVYVGNGDGLRALDGPTGTLKWLFSSANVSGSPAIGADGTVFFGCSDGSFFAVNADGTLRFKLSMGAPVSSSPAIADDGTVFVVSDQGTLWAIK